MPKKYYKYSDTSAVPASPITANMDTTSQPIKNDLSVVENYATSEDNSRHLRHAPSAPLSDNIKEARDDIISEDGFKFKLILGDDDEPIIIENDSKSKRSQSDISLKIRKDESQNDDRSDNGLIKINFNDSERERMLSDNAEDDYNGNDSMKISFNFNMNDEPELVEPSKSNDGSKSYNDSKKSQNKRRKTTKKPKRKGSSSSRNKRKARNHNSITSQNEGKNSFISF